MNEKVYKTIGFSGASSLTIGICILVTGVASGVLLIVSGARLLKSKKKISSQNAQGAMFSKRLPARLYFHCH